LTCHQVLAMRVKWGRPDLSRCADRFDLPAAQDELDVTMRVFAGLSAEQGVALHLPTAWRREDPWAALR
jgi:hypothetical protein